MYSLNIDNNFVAEYVRHFYYLFFVIIFEYSRMSGGAENSLSFHK